MQPSTPTAWMCYGGLVEEGEISGLSLLNALAKYNCTQTIIDLHTQTKKSHIC